MLQLRSPDRKSLVALTSPSPGSGKTTLGLALGMSFAATGSRTLIIDCDFVGHGMTSAMRSLVCDATSRALTEESLDSKSADGAPEKRGLMAGLLASRRMSFSDEQVAELLAAARTRAGAGDATFDNAVRALEALARSGSDKGGRSLRGILAAVEGRALKDCVTETDIPNLSLLPVGDAMEEDAKSLSHSGLERLIEACRERYDAVIIDSGPIMGSIEAAFAAAAAKDVILVVSRGERRPLVDEATARVEGIGARIAGVVFNRASTADVVRSSYASRPKSVAADMA
jgi:Mrp family chromosome partitioning ATPase